MKNDSFLNGSRLETTARKAHLVDQKVYRNREEEACITCYAEGRLVGVLSELAAKSVIKSR
jgi:hypothetical protein